MAPKITCRAFRPLRRTVAGCPRNDKPARNGGNSSKSVSSSARKTLRGHNSRILRICRRIRRFFLLLRVGVQHVAVLFPNVAQSVSFAVEGVLRQPLARAMLQFFLQP